MRALRVIVPFAVALRYFAVLGVILHVAGAAADDTKVTLCHVSPDDPSQPHTLVVTTKAASAHLEHHPLDTLGPCPASCTSASTCDDNSLCTTDVCEHDGSCSHVPVNCDDGNPCTSDSCQPTSGCENDPLDPQPCSDGDVCTGGDACDASGQCTGAPVSGCCRSDAECSDGSVCTADTCDVATGVCSHTDVTCPAPACYVGICDSVGGCTTTPVNCDDADPCTDDSCDPGSGECVHTPSQEEECQSICAQVGQSCETYSCCTGLTCSRPELGECLGADRTGCSCTAFVP
jgi:hypothetical protein